MTKLWLALPYGVNEEEQPVYDCPFLHRPSKARMKVLRLFYSLAVLLLPSLNSLNLEDIPLRLSSHNQLRDGFDLVSCISFVGKRPDETINETKMMTFFQQVSLDFIFGFRRYCLGFGMDMGTAFTL